MMKPIAACCLVLALHSRHLQAQTCENISIETGIPRVSSMSSITAPGVVNPAGVAVSLKMEIITTASLSEGGTAFALAVPGPPGTQARGFSLTFTGLTPGTDYAVRAVASSPVCGEIPGKWVIARITARDLWLYQNFGGNASLPAIGGLHADPDGDGVPNLLEWISNANPAVANPGISMPNRYFDSFSSGWRSDYTFYVWRPLLGDEWMLAQHSFDGQSWSSFGNGSFLDAEVTPTPANGNGTSLGGVSDLAFEPAESGRTWFRTMAGLIGRQRISTLFNTGLDDNRQPLADGTSDSHWLMVPPVTAYPWAIHRNSAAGFPIAPAGPWLGDSRTSGWISPAYSLTAPAGRYTYRTTFNIPYGVDPRTASISGKFTSDNSIFRMSLNAAATGITGDGNYSQFGPEWLITRGFVSGKNTLDIIVNEPDGSYTGLRVEMDGMMQRAGRVAIPGCINSGCSVLDGLSLANGASVPGVTVLKPGETTPVTPVTASSLGGWPVAAGAWSLETSSSTWMRPDATSSHAAGEYRWVREFDLTGLDPNTVEIQGRIAADDSVGIWLNDEQVIAYPAVNYTGWTAFELPGWMRSTLRRGRNTLVFRVINLANNGTNPSGLRYEFLHAAAAPLPQ